MKHKLKLVIQVFKEFTRIDADEVIGTIISAEVKRKVRNQFYAQKKKK